MSGGVGPIYLCTICLSVIPINGDAKEFVPWTTGFFEILEKFSGISKQSPNTGILAISQWINGKPQTGIAS